MPRNPATTPEPAPKRTDSPAVSPLVVAGVLDELSPHYCPLFVAHLVKTDMQARHEAGVVKYGMPLQVENGRDHMTDAYQEALNGAAYARAEHERTGKAVWADISGDFIRLCARIRYQIALEQDGEP